MFEQKRLSSSTLFKTVIFAGVLCLLIIYRGNSYNTTMTKTSSAPEQQVDDGIRKIEITAEASDNNAAINNEIAAAQNERLAPSTGNSIGDLITGSIDADKPTTSIADIANQGTTEIVASVAPETKPAQITGSNFTVQSGDTLYSISRKTGVSVASLTAANGIKNNVIRVGQVLSIPR